MQTATVDEIKLRDDAENYELEYFKDMIFWPSSPILKPFLDSIRTPLGTNLSISISSYNFKIKKLRGGNIGRCNYKQRIIYIDPGFKTDKTVILHEMIHAYEMMLLQKRDEGQMMRDILFYSLYKNLEPKVRGIDNLITAHIGIHNQLQMNEKGGNHDMLFYLKSLDLDLRLKLPLGTIGGYLCQFYHAGEYD